MGRRRIGVCAISVVLGTSALACAGDDVEIASIKCGQLFQAESTTSRALLRDVVDEVAPTIDAVGYADTRIREAVANALRIHCEERRPEDPAVAKDLARLTQSVLSLSVSDSA